MPKTAFELLKLLLFNKTSDFIFSFSFYLSEFNMQCEVEDKYKFHQGFSGWGISKKKYITLGAKLP